MGHRFDLEAIGQQLAGWRAAKYPDTWIRDLILIANCNAKPGKAAAYITKCLRNWQARGGPDLGELVRAQAKSAGAPSGGQNGSSNTVTPSQRLKAEEPEPPLSTEQLQQTIAALERVRRRSKFQEMLLQQSREELAQR